MNHESEKFRNSKSKPYSRFKIQDSDTMAALKKKNCYLN